MYKTIIEIKNDEIKNKNNEIKKLEKRIKILEQELEIEKNKEIHINSSYEYVMDYFREKLNKTELMVQILEKDVKYHQHQYSQLNKEYIQLNKDYIKSKKLYQEYINQLTDEKKELCG